MGDNVLMNLLAKAVLVCRQTRGDGGLDRLEALAREIEAAVPELAPAPAPSPADALKGMDAAERSLAVAKICATPEGAAQFAALMASAADRQPSTVS